MWEVSSQSRIVCVAEYQSSSWSSPSSATEVVANLGKQRICLHESDRFCTPLHIAAEYGNISAIELLINSGASIDECDSNYLSPLECILLMDFADAYAEAHKETFDKNLAIDAAVRLVQLGAATGIVLSCPTVLQLENLLNSTELIELRIKQTLAAGFDQTPSMLNRVIIDSCSRARVFRDHSFQLPKLLPELEGGDSGGKSLMHEAIFWSGYSALPPSSNKALQTVTPFPWHYRWPELHRMAFLTTSFKLYRRQLPHDAFKRIMNLQPERGISPLCRASSRDMLQIMENCLAMGAELDFEGCTLGSALMIACACGRLNAVKFLVRRGAAIFYISKNGLTSAVIASRRSKAITAWLLVGQFNEQKRLRFDDDEASSSSGAGSNLLRPWSGIGKINFRLIGRHQMQIHESSLDYAIRLSKLKRELRGSIVPGRVSVATP